MNLKLVLLTLAITAAVNTGLGQISITGLQLSGNAQTILDNSHFYKQYSVSLGANVTLKVTSITGTPPFHYQWQFNLTDLPDQTNVSLVFTNVQLTNAGEYTVVVTNANSSTNRTVALEVDSTFTKITTGSIVTNAGYSNGGTWGDYNNDGFLDLFVYNGINGITYNSFLYSNNNDSTFSGFTNGPPSNIKIESYSACWGDYDNDGNLDLFQSTTSTTLLFHNNGDGTFTRIINSPLSHPISVGTWVDYDNDGFLDMFLANWQTSTPQNVLYHNNGDGTFNAVTNNSLVTASGSSAWADYDNDGHMDVFIYGGNKGANRLFHNNGDSTFSSATNAGIATGAVNSWSCAWGDYDNDGFLDLYVLNGPNQKKSLYHNNGDGTFNLVTNGAIVNDTTPFDANSGGALSCAWGDYDNDGWLDMYVGNQGGPNLSPIVVNYLYHNNGDGTFTKVTSGSPVNEYSDSWGVSWADYDNDGFLDLFASRNDGRGSYLYHNNGNSNGWLEVKLIGTVSNRSAIGAKVRVHATIGGKTFWQLRQITGGSGLSSGNELRANFGLGDATNADIVRIEWPSGTVQEFSNVSARQILTYTEPPHLLATATNGVPQFSLKGGRGFTYEIDSSPDLSTWFSNSTVTITNINGMAAIVDPNPPASGQRFYRTFLQ